MVSSLKNDVPLENYSWSTGEPTEQINVLHTGKYSLTTKHLCGNFSDTVFVSGCEPLLYVPNVFSPGVPGINGYFLPVGKNLDLMHLQVYNSWGVLVYQENNPGNGWDGTFRNQLCPPGVYMWRLRYRPYNDASEIEKYGDVTLVR
jgi:gliding motility-associated-like protein